MHEGDDPDPAPLAPVEPDAAECCGSGCVRCVYDIYDEARQRYLAELEAWKIRQSQKNGQEPARQKASRREASRSGGPLQVGM